MPTDAAVNTGAPDEVIAFVRVSEMQAKLHRWAAADSGRRFDDLFNLVHDRSTLQVAWMRVKANTGGRTAGVDGMNTADVEQAGVQQLLDDLRAGLKAGTFRPMPVRERMIPKPGGSGKMRRLGIPTVADRVVQAAVKLVLEPIFEADFVPVSYGFRPRRRAHDAIAEIQLFTTQQYRWVLDADIEACFDSIDHTALMDRVRRRVADRRVLMLVKAFLKAGLLSELGEQRDTPTGTPQGGILSPLLANIALSVLDEHVHAPWKPGGTMSTNGRRSGRRRKGLPNWRIVRYADDFVVLVHGTEHDAEAIRGDIAEVLKPIGLRLSPAKTRIVHVDEGFEFLGFRIVRRRKPGTDKSYVYTFIADRPVRSVKTKIRALTHRTSQADMGATLIRLNQIIRGWALYFRHAVCKHTLRSIHQIVWWRLVRWLKTLHRWRWAAVRRHLTDRNGRWQPITANGVELFNLGKVPVTRYRYRGAIPTPWAEPATPDSSDRGEPVASRGARRVR